jgi:hypothetical protein
MCHELCFRVWGSIWNTEIFWWVADGARSECGRVKCAAVRQRSPPPAERDCPLAKGSNNTHTHTHTHTLCFRYHKRMKGAGSAHEREAHTCEPTQRCVLYFLCEGGYNLNRAQGTCAGFSFLANPPPLGPQVFGPKWVGGCVIWVSCRLLGWVGGHGKWGLRRGTVCVKFMCLFLKSEMPVNCGAMRGLAG